jgi:hypothetical protein
MSKQFVLGQKVRNVSDVGTWKGPLLREVVTVARVAVVDGKQYVAFEEYLKRYPHHLRASQSYVRVEEQTEVHVRPVYQDGKQGGVIRFDNETEARAYVESVGVVGVRYEFLPQVVSAAYLVKETRTVVAA